MTTLAPPITTAGRRSAASARHTRSLGRLVVRLGGRLGLSRREVAVYAQAECGRPWGRLGPGDLLLVLDGLRELAACRAEVRRRLHAAR